MRMIHGIIGYQVFSVEYWVRLLLMSIQKKMNTEDHGVPVETPHIPDVITLKVGCDAFVNWKARRMNSTTIRLHVVNMEPAALRNMSRLDKMVTIAVYIGPDHYEQLETAFWGLFSSDNIAEDTLRSDAQ